METPKNENKDSGDPMNSSLSPVSFKEASKVEGSANLSSEVSDNDQSSGDSQQEQNDSGSQQISNSSIVDTTSAEEKDDSIEEIPIETPATRDAEAKIKKDSPIFETNNPSKLINSSNPVIATVDKQTSLPATETKDAKRKRKTSSEQREESTTDETEARVKRAKTKSTNDNFCWRCHKESVDARCSACPRSWHRKCMGGSPPTSINETWICGECATILRAENAETRSEVVAHLSIDHLCMLLKYIVERMRSCPGSEPFWKAVDINEVPNYMDYVVRAMDLNLLEANVRAKLYGSTDAFMADAKWIQHNCIVFNTCGGVYADTTKLTNAAKQIIKTAKQEVAEIEACPDCYVRGRNLPRPHPSWFIEPCRQPHPLIWAKLKGFPFWPAKAMPRVNGQGHVDVRFFGQHDRAWVPPKDLYLYSREPPSPLPRKRKVEMAECIKEITRHCKKLEVAFGPFQFAPAKTPYNPQDPEQIKILLPQYDPLRPNEHVSSPASMARRKSPFRKRNVPLKRKLEADSTINDASAEPTSEPVVTESAPSAETEKPKETVVDPPVTTESLPLAVAKPKKRFKKSLNNSEAPNTSQDELPSSSAPAAESSSPPVADEAPRASAISNGTPEAKGAPAAKAANQSKGKNEKTVIPLEKSLAGLLRNVNARGRLSHPRSSNSKSPISSAPSSGKTESKTNSIKVYKPKARMVDKVNAEKAMKSTSDREQGKATESEASRTGEAKIVNGILSTVGVPVMSVKNTPPSNVSGTISLLSNKRDNNIIISNSLLKTTPKKLQPRILVVNNGTMETKQTHSPSDEARSKVDALKVKQEPSVSPQIAGNVQKKQSRAKKSFPNKAPRLPQLLPKLPKQPAATLDTMVYIPTNRNVNGLDYQLPPPEAGPLSAQLHRGANELAKRMGQLMEEAIKQAADSNLSETGNSADSHQATIHSLRLQIERMRWQHQQQLSELKHNTDRTLREMRASLEAETLRAIGEVRKEAADEKTRYIDELKSKQWCAQCGREALFYCCWNTAYCDHLCQQTHWQTHQRKCAQKPAFSSGVASDSDIQQQVMPHLVGGPRENWSKTAESKPREEKLERGAKTIVIYTADD